MKKTLKKGKRIAKKVMKDPLTIEYLGKQKKLIKDTLRKLVKRAERGIEKMLE